MGTCSTCQAEIVLDHTNVDPITGVLKYNGECQCSSQYSSDTNTTSGVSGNVSGNVSGDAERSDRLNDNTKSLVSDTAVLLKEVLLKE